jgi:hypothetical protein
MDTPEAQLPRTEAGRRLLRELLSVQWGDEMRRAILAIEAEALAAQPEREGLDVERLARAMDKVDVDAITGDDSYAAEDHAEHLAYAKDLAAEYERLRKEYHGLTRQSERTKTGGETEGAGDSGAGG